jgi:integrase
MAEAEMFKAALEMNNNNEDIADAIVFAYLKGARTVGAVVAEHIDLLVKPTPQTIRNYRHMLAEHIMPHLGGIAVKDLDLRHLTSWVRSMQEKKLAPKTIRNVHGLISAAMETAMRLGYRPDNPCRGVTLPTTEHAEDHEQFLTWDEWNLIYKHLNPLYQPLALFLVMSGARFGEATAVTVADLNTTSKPATVRISKSWKRDASNGYYVGAPKTRSSKRTVSLPPTCVQALIPAIEGQRGDTLLFRTKTGGRIAQRYLWDAWTAAVEDARKEDPRFTKTPRIHDLRHTSASWGLQGGLTLYEVARRLGHASTATTEKVYAHLMFEGMAKGADIMGRMGAPRELGAVEIIVGEEL